MTPEQIEAVATLLVTVSGRPATMTMELARRIVVTTLVESAGSPFGVTVDVK